MPVEYRDLLRVPYAEHSRDVGVGLNCAGVCDVVMQRLGHPPATVPVTEDDFARAVFDGGFGWDGAEWEQIGQDPAAARREGDVVLSRDGRGVHSSIVVDAARRVVLCASEGRGVFASRLENLRSVEAVYRITR